jgi:hypothetical protein
MKILIFILLLFVSQCTASIKQNGSINRQLDLIEDLKEKLPVEDRERFSKALNNIRKEESEKDNYLNGLNGKLEKSISETMDTKEISGKWLGIRNLALSLFAAAILFFGFKVFQKINLPINLRS